MAENKMLIDATHPEETRVVVLRNGRVEEFDYESAARKLLKGSIFLAKVTRVEPSLQAAFVDYGGNRHGFLAFNEIHTDYYQIPHSDRQALLEEEMSHRYEEDGDDDFDTENTIIVIDDDNSVEKPVMLTPMLSGSYDICEGFEEDDSDLADPEIEANAIDVSSLLPPLADDERINPALSGDETSMAAAERPSYGELQRTATPDDVVSSLRDAATEETEPGQTLAQNKALEEVQPIPLSSDAQAGPVADRAGPIDKKDAGSTAPSPHNDADEDEESSGQTRTMAAETSREERIVSEVIELAGKDVGGAPPSRRPQDEEAAVAPLHASEDTIDGQNRAMLSNANSLAMDKLYPASGKAAAFKADLPGERMSSPVPAFAEVDTAIVSPIVSPKAEECIPAALYADGLSRDGHSMFTETRRQADDAGEVEDRADGEVRIDVDEAGDEPDVLGEFPARRRRARSYKIQEVIKRRQVVLVQVVKEERGNKGAALTTYLSLAGRYTVLMPNTARGGGISRKITNLQDRKRLKAIAQELDVPEGMGLIIRTAGASRTKQEIKRDFEYLLRLWENVRDLTLQSTAPSLVYEEGDLIKRSIRDLYSKDIDQVLVAGEEAHKEAKGFMRMLMPSHAKNVVKYDDKIPLFARYRIEPQLNAMFSPLVHLKSGGYLVINQTEALVAVDVNSGKSTKKFSIEETALNTNLEAAEELTRQLKLRDLAGLIVIDFIDMEEKRNNRAVERRLKECLHNDRARIQVGRISHFGLLEMSRQRLRTGVLEGSTMPCQFCQGTGTIRSTESVALAVLRSLEDTLMGHSANSHSSNSITARCSRDVALYLLNYKRSFVSDMESRFSVTIYIDASDTCQGSDFSIERSNESKNLPNKIERAAVNVETAFAEPDEELEHARDPMQTRDESDRRARRKRRRRGRRSEGDMRNEGDALADENLEAVLWDSSHNAHNGTCEERESSDIDNNGEERSSRRRRGRRGGRRNRGEKSFSTDVTVPGAPQPDFVSIASLSASAKDSPALSGDEEYPLNGQGFEASDIADPLHRFLSPEDRRDNPVGQPLQATDLAEGWLGLQSGANAMTNIEIRADEAEMKNDPFPPTDLADRSALDLKPDGNAAEAASVANDQSLQNGDGETAPAKPSRSPRSEPVSSAPVLQSVVMTPEAESLADASMRPARKGWWQRRFGSSGEV